MSFHIHNKTKWKITDKYGWDISTQEHRDNKITNIINDIENLECYEINLISNEPLDIYRCCFTPSKNLLRIYPLVNTAKHPNIKFNCDNFDKAQNLIDLFCKGENLELMPLYKL